jgi:hypothetical protein
MNYYVFDTEAEANTAQALDYAEWKTSMNDAANTIYWGITYAWAVPAQRATDGKWVYCACVASTATGRAIEAKDTGGTWFPAEEA